MSENKSLLTWIGIIFGSAFLLVAVVMAEDRVGFVEHFVHVHLDEGTLEKEVNKAISKQDREQENRRNAEAWAREVEELWSSKDQ